MTIIQYSERLNEIVEAGEGLQKLASGFVFSEGPVWCSRKNQLYFTDFPKHRIYTWSYAFGLQLYTEQSNRAVGLTLDAEGRLLACESVTRRISRTEEDGTIVGLATHFQGNRLNNTNDVIVKRDGTVYFSDPYSTMLGDTQELPFNGVFRCDPVTGTVDLLVDDFKRPNGLAFSPDESLLYIDDTSKQHIRAFDVVSDGTLKNGRLFAEMDTAAGPGAADGMKVDQLGNVYVTGPGGVWIFAPSGERLGRIEFPEVAANLCFGSPPDSPIGTTLFITASSALYSIKLKVCGAV
ncbi:SMP-30/gluconolactonase/LRE family protein [Paenibacillus agricola]|uniref:SMP-30/gluconolactonase/LRE family protein n=1 Tax=Paenibacillus agricola TaxID=2716264 RepID=A0ABX0J360_9BACL|nr:SMP-30/gluconolactonase/LRE family protein [Paenibacillus agricola]NHN29845.1 SMP-30/gluconolactonase/LRE family protein [Paenibacillus agricola]